MMICSKCGVEKDETNYQRYFHSTQNKWRVRRECTECLYKTRLKRKNPDLFYSQNPNYKKCISCNEWKTLEEYYFHQKTKGIRFSDCISCHRDRDRRERLDYLENNGGSDKILSQPNQYMDEYQKRQTFFVMELLGYTYNEETGIWTKPGIKEVIDGNVVFPKVKKRKRLGHYETKVTYEMMEKFVELKNRGWNSEKIGDKFGVSDTTVFKYIKKWNDTLR